MVVVLALLLAGCFAAPIPADSELEPNEIERQRGDELPGPPATKREETSSQTATVEPRATTSTPRKCTGEDREEYEIPDTRHKLRVTLWDAWNETAVAGAYVAAVIGLSGDDHTPEFDYSGGLSNCIIDSGVTDEQGIAILDVVPGDLWLVHEHDWPDETYTEEAAKIVVAGEDEATLDVWPTEFFFTWNGTFAGIDPLDTHEEEVRYESVFGNKSKDILERLYVFSPKVELTWNNGVTGADLYPGLAVDGRDRFTREIGDQQQEMNDGPSSDDGFAFWMDYDRHHCQAWAKGLSLVVYDSGWSMAPGAENVAGVPFEFTFMATLIAPTDWRNSRLPCGE